MFSESVLAGLPFPLRQSFHADRAAVCFGPWWGLGAGLGAGLGPGVFVLAVPGRCFCCGSLLFLLSVFVLWFGCCVGGMFCGF